jgi:FkbM family methyltransferase
MAMETVEHFGISLDIDPAYMSENMIEVLRAKRYETTEAKQLQRLIQANEVVLEIGAGIGFISALITKNPLTRRVVSYEANPALIDGISTTVRRNTGDDAAKWEIRNAVLMTGDIPEAMDFYVHQDFWASSLTPIPDAKEVARVAVQNFNAVLAEIRPTLIVCDIEGGEMDLFKNADLSGVKKVYMEIHQRKVGRNAIRELFGYFHARDFHYDQAHSAGAVVLFSHVDRDKR